jgi:chromosome transmission fidelity protein 4
LDAGKVERALDLIDRLHLEKSYGIAIRMADHNRKLVDLIEDAKERRFLVEDNVDAEAEYSEESSPTSTFMDRLAPSRQISPEASLGLKRNFGPHVNAVSKRKRIS